MKINIFGSTGIIGIKTLNLIKNFFPNIKINLMVANKNINLIHKQILIYQPKYVYLEDEEKSQLLKKKLTNSKTILISKNKLRQYLNNSKSNFTILAISGYNSLQYFEEIIENTDNFGIVSKEAIVSAGHLFKQLKIYNNTNLFPLDSEHFSLFNLLNNNFINNKIEKLYLTASGGPFLGRKFNTLKNVSFNEAKNHPKWNMGYKNSIDSATLVNKCLEIIEAHYLFNIPYNKIDILLHPQSIVHSMILKNNYIYNMSLFKNDMSIPIINFLSISKNIKNNSKIVDKSLFYDFNEKFTFSKIKNAEFPIYKYFKKIDKKNPTNIIKFNIANEYAVNLYKNKKINYTDIYKIIKKIASLNLYYSTKNIKDIIKYHELFENYIYKKLS